MNISLLSDKNKKHMIYQILKQSKTFVYTSILLFAILFVECKNQSIPKPRAYYRISFPEHSYHVLDKDFPYSFEIPDYTKISEDHAPNAEPYWINISYPAYKGQIHISHKFIHNNLAEILEDSRKLAYKHSIKADAIGEKLFVDSEKEIYGILYDIKGDAASSLQFFLTDSVRNFLRGSLYFNSIPNKDSLAPVISFVREDIIHLMETFEWKSISNK
jgi:gliding motility-associated lipoprotein GldD